jgi:hypothetical protein
MKELFDNVDSTVLFDEKCDFKFKCLSELEIVLLFEKEEANEFDLVELRIVAVSIENLSTELELNLLIIPY